MTRALILFAKAPVAGRVKTRLMPQLGAEGAAELYRRLLTHSLRQLSRAVVERRCLYGAPGPGEGELQALAARFGWDYRPQQGDGLGPRMHLALRAELGRSDEALLVGSDCAVLDADYIARAFAKLQRQDLVLGPTEDGGYVLVGARRAIPEALFQDIDWGTAQVMTQTRARLAHLAIRYALLEPLWDVDEWPDLMRLAESPLGESLQLRGLWRRLGLSTQHGAL